LLPKERGRELPAGLIQRKMNPPLEDGYTDSSQTIEVEFHLVNQMPSGWNAKVVGVFPASKGIADAVPGAAHQSHQRAARISEEVEDQIKALRAE